MIGSETPSIWSFQRAIGENGKNSLVHSFEQPGALVSHSLKDSQKTASAMLVTDVEDEMCCRQL